MKKTLQIVDLFAGAGGASTGMRRGFEAIGQPVHITAVNHWDLAVKSHELNHPTDQHLCTDIMELSPTEVYTGGEGNLTITWASPSCTAFSYARGGKPVEAQLRSLADAILWWAREKKPEIILVENVRQFLDNGPLIQKRSGKKLAWEKLSKHSSKTSIDGSAYAEWKNKTANLGGTFDEWKKLVGVGRKWVTTWDTPPISPRGKKETESAWIDRLAAVGWRPAMVADPSKKGEDFLRWKAELEAAGYITEWRILCAADYGDPTIRKRFFLQAHRLDTGRKPVWPSPTHGKVLKDGSVAGGLRPWRSARDYVIDWSDIGTSIFKRKRPLAPKTMKRIYAGLEKYGIKPFIVPKDRGWDGKNIRSVDSPVSALTTNHRGEMVINPFLIPTAHGGDPTRAESVDAPLKTVTGNRGDQAVCIPQIIKLFGQSKTGSVDDPSGTVSGCGHEALANTVLIPQMIKLRGTGKAGELDVPVDALTAGGNHQALGLSFLVPHFGERAGQAPRTHSVDKPLSTACGSNILSLAQPRLTPVLVDVAHGNDTPSDDNRRAKSIEDPLGTQSCSNTWGVAQPVLIVTDNSGMNASGVCKLEDPLATTTTKQRHAIAVPWLYTYYSSGSPGADVDEPAPTMRCKEGTGLCYPIVEWDGNQYLLDIYFRMLQPAELLKAQGFPAGYRLAGTKTDAVKMIGNSNPVGLSAALTLAAYTQDPMAAWKMFEDEEKELKTA